MRIVDIIKIIKKSGVIVSFPISGSCWILKKTLCLTGLINSDCAGQSQHQSIGKDWRRLKTSPDIELFGSIVDCMHQQRADADVF